MVHAKTASSSVLFRTDTCLIASVQLSDLERDLSDEVA